MEYKLLVENWRNFRKTKELEQLKEAPEEFFGVNDPMVGFAMSAQTKLKDKDVEGALEDLEMFKKGSEIQGELTSLLIPVGGIGQLTKQASRLAPKKFVSYLQKLFAGPTNSLQYLSDAIFAARVVPLKDRQKVAKILKYAISQLPARRIKLGMKPGSYDRVPLDAESLSKYSRVFFGNKKPPEYIRNFPAGKYGDDDLEQIIGDLSRSILRSTK
tara:strand:+ start:210 stop:854 length:645 start_codon:yes stop_codon:yes gene_type:complete